MKDDTIKLEGENSSLGSTVEKDPKSLPTFAFHWPFKWLRYTQMASPTHSAACQSKFFLSAKWRKIWFGEFIQFAACVWGSLRGAGSPLTSHPIAYSRYTLTRPLAFKCTPFNWCLTDNQSYGEWVAGIGIGTGDWIQVGGEHALNSANIIQSTLGFDSMRIRCVCRFWGGYQSSYRCVG